MGDEASSYTFGVRRLQGAGRERVAGDVEIDLSARAQPPRAATLPTSKGHTDPGLPRYLGLNAKH